MSRDTGLRIGIVVLGVVIFSLLFFADKTNLNNETSARLGQAEASVTSEEKTQSLPPLAPDAQLDGWLSSLSSLEGVDKVPVLDSIVANLVARNRLAYAADYAAQRAVLQGNASNQLEAGLLSQRATELPYVVGDTSMVRRYQQQAMRFLESVLATDPNNEDALLASGLIRIQTGPPMQGIQAIRRVLEINPDNLEASMRLGEMSLQTGQFAKAQQRFEKVLSLDPDQQMARYGLAVALIQLGQPEAAKPLLETVVSKSQDPEVKQAAQALLAGS